MAAVSAWAKPGAWAAAVEEEEKEKGYDSADSSKNASEFPSLAAAAATKTSKKKKAQPVSLAEFTTGQAVSYGSGNRSVSRGLSSDEVLQLPTGPRERTAEELERASSRGFGNSSYGNRGGPRDEANPRWGSGSGSSRVSDEPRRNGFGGGGGGSNRDLGPSRADEVDDWGAGKRSIGAPERRRESGFFDSQSRADESESWVSNKTAPPLSNGRKINGSGFDGPRERRGGFDAYGKGESNGRADSDIWGKKKEETSSGGRPRIVLQPRTLPLVNESSGDPPVKSKGENPFGAARPREEVLAEKGQDWKKIDEKLELTKIREAPQEGKIFGRKGSRNGNGALEDRAERSWRKAENETMSAPARAEEAEEQLPEN
ncbi:putative plant specific eukaryotic initiation factor 4B [Dioscorea sansibarensis]